MSLNKVWNC